MRHVAPAVAVLSCAIALNSSCAPAVDLTRALLVEAVSTGWYEVDAAEGQIKLVPAVAFTLKNASDLTLRTLQVNAVFRRVTEETEWGTGFRTVAGSSGLAPAATTDRVFVASPLGYTGTESRFDMLKNSRFVDARVEIFAKFAATRWTRVAVFPIARHLIEP